MRFMVSESESSVFAWLVLIEDRLIHSEVCVDVSLMELTLLSLRIIVLQTWALGAFRAPGANQAILVAWARPGTFFSQRSRQLQLSAPLMSAPLSVHYVDEVT